MDLHAKGLDIVGAVGAAGEVREVELDLVPALVESHGHSADERLDTGGGLIVRSAESSAHVLVVEDHDLESEVLAEVLDNHDEERQLDAQHLLGVGRAGHIGGTNVRSHDLQDRGLDIRIGNTLDVAVTHLLVPDLQRLAPILECKKYLYIIQYKNGKEKIR